MRDYRQIFGIKKTNMERILRVNPSIEQRPGIYAFYRKKGEKTALYIGQAKNCLERLGSHLSGYKTKNASHIDKSLQKHKLYGVGNEEGWNVLVLEYCKNNELDTLEKFYIEKYRNQEHIELYNITAGGQDAGKVDIAERNNAKLKSYKNGKNLGREKLLNEIRTYFEKYLDFTIKGEPSKLKARKYDEFKNLLRGE